MGPCCSSPNKTTNIASKGKIKTKVPMGKPQGKPIQKEPILFDHKEEQQMNVDQEGPWIFAMGNIYGETKVLMEDEQYEQFIQQNNLNQDRGGRLTTQTQEGQDGVVFDDNDNFTPEEIQEMFQKLMDMEDKLEPNAGGIAINVCRAASRFMRANPEQTTLNKLLMVGSCGQGPMGQAIMQLLRDESISSCIYQDSNNMTDQTVSAVCISDQEKTKFAIQNCNQNYPMTLFNKMFEPNEDEGARKKPVENCKHFFTTSYFLQSCPEQVEIAMLYANQTNKGFSFYVDSDYSIKYQKKQFMDCLKSADTVFMSNIYVLLCLKHLKSELNIDSDFNETQFAGLNQKDFTKEQHDIMKQIIQLGGQAICDAEQTEPKTRQRVLIVTDFPNETMVFCSKFGKYDGFSETLPLTNEVSKDAANVNLADECFMGGFLAMLSMLETDENRFNDPDNHLYSYDDIMACVAAGNLMAQKMIHDKSLDNLDINNLAEAEAVIMEDELNNQEDEQDEQDEQDEDDENEENYENKVQIDEVQINDNDNDNEN